MTNNTDLIKRGVEVPDILSDFHSIKLEEEFKRKNGTIENYFKQEFYKRLQTKDGDTITLSVMWTTDHEPNEWCVILYNSEFNYEYESHRENYEDFLLVHPEMSGDDMLGGGHFLTTQDVEYFYIRSLSLETRTREEIIKNIR